MKYREKFFEPRGVRKQDIAVSSKCSDLAIISPSTPNFEFLDPIPTEDW